MRIYKFYGIPREGEEEQLLGVFKIRAILEEPIEKLAKTCITSAMEEYGAQVLSIRKCSGMEYEL